VAFTPAWAGHADADETPRVHLRDFRGDGAEPPRKADVERGMRHWIAARIVAALDAGRPPSDIAVLVRKNAEGEAIERLLRRRGVPCRVKRRGGFFHGPSADALRLLLEWIEDAGDPDVQARILLLPFTRRDAEDLPRGRPARIPPLLAEWAGLARAGRWPAFFDAVRRQGGYRDRLAAESPSEAERFDRLTRILSEAGAAPHVGVRALRERFDALRRGEGEEGLDGGEPSEEVEGVVSVMTLHMSKGLEFPVVFLAAAGEGAGSDHFVLRPPGEKGFRIALNTQDAAAREEHALQERGEEKRLFYVAFTRAKEELHIPLLPFAFKQRSAGPLGGFAAEALRAAAAAASTRSLFRWDENPVSDAVRETRATALPEPEPPAPRRERLLEEARAAFARRRNLASYSALSRHDEARPSTAAPSPAPAAETSDEVLEDSGARVRREEPAQDAATSPEAAVERQTAEPGISAEDLPPGAASGTALHAILENTVFSSAAEARDPEAWLQEPGRRAQIEDALKRESVDGACAPAAARAVWNTLRMPLPDPAGGADFRLAHLPNVSDYRHEVEFLLPFEASNASGEGARLPEGVSRRGNFLWGFIDLVFRHEGRYYLLDWKSNLLPAYDAASIRRSMEAHDYDLQWKLYSVVLDRWLQKQLPDYDPAVHFGGVHYLYLRGAGPDRFSGFAVRPTARQLRADFPQEIARLMDNVRGDARGNVKADVRGGTGEFA
jgi:exodeoxyribonuclease V beta subunit